MSQTLDYCQRPRVAASPTAGHYESWFLRGNDPRQARAFWIRYTVFVPQQDPAAAIGELWGIFFDRTGRRVMAAQQDLPWREVKLTGDPLALDLAGSTLSAGRAQGSVRGQSHRLGWDLTYAGGGEPLFLLPRKLYDRGFPKAKSLVSRPLVRFRGHLEVDGEAIAIDDWIGSENHNWGRRHTDAYAWGQVCGFDGAPNVFLECASARLRMGPLWIPQLSVAVLRDGDRTYHFNSLNRAFINEANYDSRHWHLQCSDGHHRLTVDIANEPADMVALRYKNPPGGLKTCLNSKLAACRVALRTEEGELKEWTTDSRAAFEILTDQPPEGMPYGN